MTLRVVRWVQQGRQALLVGVVLIGLLATSGQSSTLSPGSPPPAANRAASPGALEVAAGGSLTCIPTSAHATGAVGTNWRTDLEVHNPGATQASYTIALLKHGSDNSNPASQSFSLAPGQSVRYADVVFERFAFNGKAALRVNTTAGTILVTSRTFNDLGPSGTFGQFVPAFPDDQAITSAEDARLIQLSHRPSTASGFRTNIGVVNATAATIAVTIDLYEADRTKLGQVALSLRPFEYQQADKVFERVTGAAVADGFAIVRTSTVGGRFHAYASVIDNRTSDPIFIPAARVSGGAMPPASTSTKQLAATQVYWIATSAHATGVGGTNWRTDLEVHNPGSGQMACAFELLKHATDNSKPAAAGLTMAPGRAIRFSDVIKERFVFDGKAALRVTTTSPAVVTSRTYNDQPGGTYGQFVPAFPDDQAITSAEQGRLIQLSHQPDAASGGFRTNLGVVNATAGPITVTIALHKADGMALGQVPLSLRAYDYQQVDKVFERVTASAVADGYAILRTSDVSGRFFAYASVIDNRTSDPIFIPAQKTSSAFTYGPPRVVTVNTGSATEVADPITGATIVFPQGGHGTLTTSTITSAPYQPTSWGIGFHIGFTGPEPIRFKLPETAGAETQVYAWGPSHGCFDGPPRAERWNPWPETSVGGGYLLFDTPDDADPASRAPEQRATASAAATPMPYHDYWVNKITPGSTDGQQIHLVTAQVKEDINGWLGKLSDPLLSAARAQLANSFPIRVYADAKGAGYIGFARRRIIGTSFSPRLVFDLGNIKADVVAHETGHLMTHLLARAVLASTAGDARYLRIEDLAPQNHALGEPQTAPETTSEEMAYLTQYLVSGTVDQIDPYDMKTVVPGYFLSTPRNADTTKLEGLGVLLLANLMRSSATMNDWERKSATVPVIGASWHDLAGIVGRGATNITEYKDNIQSFLDGRGQGDRLGITAERLGWSYHGKGKVLATGTRDPVAGVAITNFVKIGGTEHVASQTTTDASGQYKLPRVIPGCSMLRVAKGQHTVDYSSCTRWDLPTTQEITLSDSFITVDPPVGNPTVTVNPASGTTVKHDVDLSFVVTATPVAGTTITRIELWKGTFFLGQCFDSQTCNGIATSQVPGGLGTVTFTAWVHDSRNGPSYRFDFSYTWVL